MRFFRVNVGVIIENIKIAVSSLIANKTRSVLTTLGIIIGITTIISLISMINGLNEYVASLLSSFGSNTFNVMKIPPMVRSGEEWRRVQRRPDIEIEDAQAIEENCPSVEFVSMRVYTQKKAKYEGEETDYIFVVGVNEAFQNMENLLIKQGRFISQEDVDHSRLVCVIGYDIEDALFVERSPIGERIKVGGYPLRVVGTIDKLGSIFGQSRDNIVFVPVTTFRKMFGWNSFAMVIVKPMGNGSPVPAIDEVRMLMRQRHQLRADDEDDFTIQTQKAMLGLFQSLTGAIFAAMIGVGGISLIVGGVGIMNVMLVSITERTREIGIRKAIGAKRSDILGQFLYESAILSVIGGAFGVGLASILVKVVSNFTGLPSSLSIWVIVLGVGFSVVVGLVFGIYPANKASKMDPIYALRFE